MSAARPQIQRDDASEPEKLRKVLNEILLGFSTRFEALEATKGLTVLPEVTLEIGGTYATNAAPFLDGGVRVSCPFSPTGLVVLRVEQTQPPGQPVLTSAISVDWKFVGGPSAGDGALVINYVSGLAINSRYSMRLGVTRG